MRVVNKLNPNDEQINGFLDNQEEGPIFMVNLLKFKKNASYSDNRESNLSGIEAYDIYSKEVKEHLKNVGGEIVFSGAVSRLMLGEVEELWDAVAIAKYPNRKAMLEMIMNEDYLKSAVHREAGLEGQLNIETLSI